VKKIFYVFILSFALVSCGTPPTRTTFSTGPSVGLGPISIGLSIDSNGQVELNRSLSIPLLADKDLGAGLNWDITFSTVLREASAKNDYLIVLWQDENGSTHEQDFPIGQPFEVNFEHDQWVRKIQRMDNGSIVVFVEKQKLVQEMSSSNSQSNNLQSSEPVSSSNNYWCDDLELVKLKVGDNAKVTWLKINLRSEPVVSDPWDQNIVAQLEKGVSLVIIGGPECAHNGTWWQVRTESGDTGWSREYTESNGYLMR